jgi:hypothetical protein
LIKLVIVTINNELNLDTGINVNSIEGYEGAHLVQESLLDQGIARLLIVHTKATNH